MANKSFDINVGLAEMLKGGVIMDVTNVDQAKIAEDAGAVAVMALERIPADIRKDGGIARMSDPELIQDIQSSVDVPVMAKCRIGHFAEAQILESLKVDFIDESEVLTPADDRFHIDKNKFKIPHVGWNNIGIKKNSILLNGIKDGSDFYFDHSFAVIDTKKNVDCITNHQINFASVMSCKNIFGVQFHPEKSGASGLKLIKNFMEL